ncbi:tetratricopeptide repeat protein [Glycomyces dulcitolivorans]|uniref:tetratricopeptide repeat protein n=1 Tax=Glycomyces dulcitolivorans TaxID=2200759 RepID=UPI000DD2EB4E|nr:tetratricopeptide repeat protein [Glycomyces dulcitolivorans]
MTETPFPHSNYWGRVGNVLNANTMTVTLDPRPRPSEVPAPTLWWTNHEALLDGIVQLFRDGARGAVVVHAGRFHGLSAFASELAARIDDELTGGHRYIDLRGLTDWDALELFLQRNGFPVGPGADLPSLTSAYRTVVGNRRALVVVDGVADLGTAKVFRPANGVFYVVLSEDPLQSWTEARRFKLPPLERAHAVSMLTKMDLGLDADTVGEIADSLPRLPGLLRDAAVLVSQGLPLAELVDLAGDEQRFFLAAFNLLPPTARRYYRVLAALGGGELQQCMLTGLAGTLGADPEAPLRQLETHRLIEELRPGVWRLRLAPQPLDTPDRGADALPADLADGVRFTTRWLIRRAQLADRASMGRRTRAVPDLLDLEGAEDDCPGFDGQTDAREWLTANRRMLVRLVHSPSRRTPHEAVALCEALWAFYSGAAHFDEAAGCYETAVEAAEGDPWAQVRMTQLLGKCLANLRRWEAALDVLHRSLDMADRDGDPVLVGTSLEFIGRTLHKAGRSAESLDWLERAAANGVIEADDRAIGLRRWMLGDAHRALGDLPRAVAEYRSAIEHLDRAEDIRTTIIVMIELSFAELATGDPAAAARLESAVDFANAKHLTRYEADAARRYAELLEAPAKSFWLKRAGRLYRAEGHPAAAEIEQELNASGQTFDED